MRDKGVLGSCEVGEDEKECWPKMCAHVVVNYFVILIFYGVLRCTVNRCVTLNTRRVCFTRVFIFVHKKKAFGVTVTSFIRSFGARVFAHAHTHIWAHI